MRGRVAAIAHSRFWHLLIEWFFPAERRRAWLKHSVEEIGNLQFFLPALYSRHAGR
jgi:hypothetical protein